MKFHLRNVGPKCVQVQVFGSGLEEITCSGINTLIWCNICLQTHWVALILCEWLTGCVIARAFAERTVGHFAVTRQQLQGWGKTRVGRCLRPSAVHTAAPKFYLPQRCLSENIFCDNLEEDIGSYRWLEQYLQVLSLQSKWFYKISMKKCLVTKRITEPHSTLYLLPESWYILCTSVMASSVIVAEQRQ